MLRTPDQNRQLHTLLGKLSIDAEVKQELVYEFTAGRETSSSKMEVKECQALINHLNHIVKHGGDKTDKQRKKILSICYEMNWTVEGGRIDWPRLNAFLLKSGYLKKELNTYTAKELPKLVSQFENLLKSYYAKR